MAFSQDRLITALLFLFLGSAWTGCYSFRGFNISPEIETFYVDNFLNTTTNAPPTINQTFQEALKIKVQQESRLSLAEIDPDIEFKGSVSGFQVTSVAPQPGERTAFNRLEITVSINYVNNREEEKDWDQRFSFFEDFPAESNLLDIQDQLIDNIFNQIIEDIFNKAFTDW